MFQKLMSRKVLLSVLVFLGVLLSEAGSLAGNWNGSFRWQAGKSSLDLSSRANASIAAELDALASSVEAGKIARVSVRSYSSPEGSLSWNTKLAARRSEAVVSLLKEKLPGLADSQIVVNDVPEDWASAEQFVHASSKPWKDEALQLLKSGKNDLETQLQDLWGGVVWDELLWNCFTRIRRTEICVEYTTDIEFSATSASPAEKPVGTPVCIKFPAGRSDILSGFLDNAGQIRALEEFVASLPAGSVVVLDALSSPEGKLSWNQTLGRRRAEAVKRQLVGLGVSADRITVRSCDENWAGLREVVASSWFGPDKNEILQILDDASLSGAVKKARLEALDGGAVWSRLIVASMQSLRCVKISSAAE